MFLAWSTVVEWLTLLWLTNYGDAREGIFSVRIKKETNSHLQKWKTKKHHQKTKPKPNPTNQTIFLRKNRLKISSVHSNIDSLRQLYYLYVQGTLKINNAREYAANFNHRQITELHMPIWMYLSLNLLMCHCVLCLTGLVKYYVQNMRAVNT